MTYPSQQSIFRRRIYDDKLAKIQQFLSEGHSKGSDGLQVIADFDLTITSPGSEQCHHMFETSAALPEKLRLDLASFMRGAVQVSSYDEWWEAVHGLLMRHQLTRAQISAVVRGARVSLRPGTEDLLRLLHKLGVPLLIVSAGITDVIQETLSSHGLLLDNISICSNTMIFGDDDKLVDFKETPPVHSRNKSSTNERESVYFAKHAHRQCVVVVGDRPGDAHVTCGLVPDEKCIKVGFYNCQPEGQDAHEDKLNDYRENFDVVACGENQRMCLVSDIIQDIIGKANPRTK